MGLKFICGTCTSIFTTVTSMRLEEQSMIEHQYCPYQYFQQVDSIIKAAWAQVYPRPTKQTHAELQEPSCTSSKTETKSHATAIDIHKTSLQNEK